MSSEGRSLVSFGVYVGTDWRIDCYEYPNRPPILAFDAGPNSVTVTVRGRDADDAALGFARELSAKVQRFAAEMERLHATKLAEDADPGVRCAGCGRAADGTAA
jgi:hypothetical protein